jgi:hypothetical protein
MEAHSYGNYYSNPLAQSTHSQPSYSAGESRLRFEPVISAIKRLQIYAFNRMASRTGYCLILINEAEIDWGKRDKREINVYSVVVKKLE